MSSGNRLRGDGRLDFFGDERKVVEMHVTESVNCPFCGQAFEMVIDTSTASQQFTTDCEICCRPFEVRVECEPGEILSLDVLGN
jgi:transcription elongation factor Elf1